MFILQMPVGGPTTPAMPRTGGPGSDPWGPALDHATQRHATNLRGITRSTTIVGRTMTTLLGTECTYNPDGSYSRPGDTGKYYYQADGSIFYSGGTITTSTGTVTARGAQTLRRPTTSGSTWDSSANGNRPLDHTYALNQLDLVPDGSGGFTHPGEGNTGRYLLQPDGSIFYEGGQMSRRAAAAQTYRGGSWHTTGTNSSALPGTLNMQRGRFSLIGNRLVMCPGCGDSLHILPDGRILNINHDGSSGSIYNNGTWTDLSATDRTNSQIQTGIRAIIASRTARGIRYPGH